MIYEARKNDKRLPHSPSIIIKHTVNFSKEIINLLQCTVVTYTNNSSTCPPQHYQSPSMRLAALCQINQKWLSSSIYCSILNIPLICMKWHLRILSENTLIAVQKKCWAAFHCQIIKCPPHAAGRKERPRYNMLARTLTALKHM